MPLSIRTQILQLLVDRMKNIVDGLFVRYTQDNSNQLALWTATGDFALSSPVKVTAEVTATGSEVTFTYGETVVAHDFSADANFVLFDTGFTITITDLNLIILGDTYDLRCNSCVLSAVDVRSVMDGSAGSAHPFIQIFPSERPATNSRNAYYRDSTAEFDIQIEADFGLLNTDYPAELVLEMIADIENEIQRDPNFQTDDGVCLAIDAQIVRDTPYISKANVDIAGAFLFLEVQYRTSLQDARTMQI